MVPLGVTFIVILVTVAFAGLGSLFAGEVGSTWGAVIGLIVGGLIVLYVALRPQKEDGSTRRG